MLDGPRHTLYVTAVMHAADTCFDQHIAVLLLVWIPFCSVHRFPTDLVWFYCIVSLILSIGTEEHRIHEATRPVGAGTGIGTMGTTGATGYGSGVDTGYGTGMGTGAGYGTTGVEEKKPLAQKIKEVIPGMLLLLLS